MLLLALFSALLEGNYVFATRGRDNQGGRLLTPEQAHPDYPTGSCFYLRWEHDISLKFDKRIYSKPKPFTRNKGRSLSRQLFAKLFPAPFPELALSHDLDVEAAVARTVELAEVNALPDAERQLAAGNRDGLGSAHDA